MRRASGKKISWSRTLRSLVNLDASEIHAQRLSAKEVLVPKNGDDDGETVKSARTRLFEVLAITGTAFDDLVVQRLTLNDGNEGNKCAVTKISRDSPCADNPDIVVFRKGGLNPVCCSKDMTTDKPKGGRPKNSRELRP